MAPVGVSFISGRDVSWLGEVGFLAADSFLFGFVLFFSFGLVGAEFRATHESPECSTDWTGGPKAEVTVVNLLVKGNWLAKIGPGGSQWPG